MGVISQRSRKPVYGAFSGVTIPFVPQERRGFKSSNFTVIFLFVTLKMFKVNDRLSKNKRLAVSQMAFRARKVFRTFEKPAPDPDFPSMQP